MSRAAALEKMRAARRIDEVPPMSERMKELARLTTGIPEPGTVMPTTAVVPSREPAKGYVYFIQAGNLPYVKIGFSRTAAHHRIEELQTGCPLELHILRVLEGDIDMEHEFHCRFAEHRVRGEWFRIVPEMRALFRKGRVRR